MEREERNSVEYKDGLTIDNVRVEVLGSIKVCEVRGVMVIALVGIGEVRPTRATGGGRWVSLVEWRKRWCSPGERA